MSYYCATWVRCNEQWILICNIQSVAIIGRIVNWLAYIGKWQLCYFSVHIHTCYLHISVLRSFYTCTSLSIWLHDWIACLDVLVYNKPSLVEIMQIDCSSFEWRLKSINQSVYCWTYWLALRVTTICNEQIDYPTGRKYSRQFEFCISLKSNSLNLNSAYYYIFWNLSMIAFIIEIQKIKICEY